MQYKFVMFQTRAVSPLIFRFPVKSFRSSSCSEKSGKTGKNAPSVTGGKRAVTLCARVNLQTIPVKMMYNMSMLHHRFSNERRGGGG